MVKDIRFLSRRDKRLSRLFGFAFPLKASQENFTRLQVSGAFRCVCGPFLQHNPCGQGSISDNPTLIPGLTGEHTYRRGPRANRHNAIQCVAGGEVA